MKKIPTLFERVYDNHKINHKIIGITSNVCPGMEWVLEGKGVATVKWDGACCAIINGELYARYDAKKGKTPPDGAISCCDPDPITGHWPHWIKCSAEDPQYKWYWSAYKDTLEYFDTDKLVDKTYEAIGKHFNGNPYNIDYDCLVPHGITFISEFNKPNEPRTFDAIKQWLIDNEEEGIVFWLDGEPKCKIKRTDFGFKWPIK